MRTYIHMRFIFCLFIICIITGNVYSQGVGIGTQIPDVSARLDVSSSNQGMLVPRLTSAQRDVIISPAEGLLIYNVDSKCFNFFRAGNWYEVCGNCIPPASPQVSNSGPVCENDTVRLYASTVLNGVYSWTGPNGFTSNQQNPVINKAGLADGGVYSVSVSINNCTSVAVNSNVIVHPIPSASYTSLPATGQVNNSVIFTPLESGATYSWTFQSGNPSSSTLENPSVIWNAVGTYQLTLNISKNGCSNSIIDTIDVTNCPSGSQTINYTGTIEAITIPPCVTSVTIEAWGAQGGLNQSGTAGANGAYMKGTFSVQGGETYYVLVGGQGTQSPSANSSSGGGGSFVVKSDPNSSYIYNGVKVTPLLVAGGGGGVGSSGTQAGVPGSTGLDGTLDNRGYGQPGINGYGGISGSVNNENGGGGGGGFIGNGLPKKSNSGYPGLSFLNGGAGGSSRDNNSYGGFGGGGGNHETNGGGGGGGGWSGGTGGQYESVYGGGGGGGSYNSGTNQNNVSNANSGNGKVVFSW